MEIIDLTGNLKEKNLAGEEEAEVGIINQEVQIVILIIEDLISENHLIKEEIILEISTGQENNSQDRICFD